MYAATYFQVNLPLSREQFVFEYEYLYVGLVITGLGQNGFKNVPMAMYGDAFTVATNASTLVARELEQLLMQHVR